MHLKPLLLLSTALLGVRCETDGPGEAATVVAAPMELASKPRSHLRRGRDRSDRELGVYTARVLVQYRNGKGREVALARSSRLYHDFDDRSVLAVEIGERDLAELSNDPNIESIEEDHIYEEQGFHERTITEEDPEHRRLAQSIPYGISMVQADQLSTGPYPVKVCIADTGVARLHPDLPQWILSGNNRDSSISGARLFWSIDARGHGTHVTGTICARNNGYGVRGVGNIPVYMTRALDDNGQARESDVYNAVSQCVGSGAKVISMSLGGSGMSQTFKDLLTNLYDNYGFLLVGASGNNGQNGVSWPGAHPRVIAVGAVKSDRTRWSGSNYGTGLELAAPGNMVLSTSINRVGSYVYSYYSGTSMATPHVAGVASLVWSYFPLCTNTQIRYALTRTALDVGSGGCDAYYGWGIVQARAAYNWLAANPCQGATWGRNSAPQGGCASLL